MNAQTQQARPAPVRRNGVDVGALFATIDAVKADTGLAEFHFRASNRLSVPDNFKPLGWLN